MENLLISIIYKLNWRQHHMKLNSNEKVSTQLSKLVSEWGII